MTRQRTNILLNQSSSREYHCRIGAGYNEQGYERETLDQYLLFFLANHCSNQKKKSPHGHHDELGDA